MKPYTLASERAASAHWMRVHRTAVLEQVVPLGR